MQPGRVKTSGIFFSVASLYAALTVPLALLAMTGHAEWAPGLVAFGHAHEMLFGFALLLVTGYLLNTLTFRLLSLLLGLWFAARISYMVAPDSLPAVLLSPLYSVVLALLVVPKFKSAKKWRNRSVMFMLSALCLLPAVFALAAMLQSYLTRHEILLTGILLLSLLMAFMGGRVIAPAVGGAFYRIGVNFKERVQPRLEGAIIILITVAAVAVFLPGSRYATGIPACVAGLLLALRLWRWRLWQLPGRSDLWCLGIGYGWLALGLLFLGGQLLADKPVIPALHLITVGALGTLSICIMTRVNLQQLRRDPADEPRVTLAVALIVIASLARFAAQLMPDYRNTLLWVAAGAWSLAYLLVVIWLLPGMRVVLQAKSTGSTASS